MTSEPLAADDLEAVGRALSAAAMTLLAIHRLALEDNDEFAQVAIRELARSAFKRVDAVRSRVTGAVPLGNMADEFDDD